jgi:hypothetical protein
MRELTTADDFETIQIWLNTNLKENKSFVPCKDELKKIKSKDDSKSKGIYFWFMRPEGYVALRNFASIQAIEPIYPKILENVKYDLVYLGTTGNGKQRKNNLYGRFNWHINQIHTEKTINREESFLSTLRTGLGSLLADDLIIPNTETIINDFMKKYMKVFWIEYPDNKTLIDNDEKILIKEIKPLLNLKHNPNNLRDAMDNPTKEYRARRNAIEKSTKKRLGFQKTKDKKSNIPTRLKINKTDKKIQIPSMEIKDKCFEKTFINAEDIYQFAKNTKFKEGQWSFIFYETKKPGNIIKLGRGETGNPSTYMESDLKPKLTRWRFIKEEMIRNNIEKLTVKFCPKVND